MCSKALVTLLVMAVMVVASGVMMAQGTKQIHVTFPQSVVVGKTTLAPGDYTFKEVSDGVLQVFDKDTMRAEAAVIPVNTENNQPSDETKVVMSKFGGNQDFHIDKIWVQGRASGYEFAMPDSLKSLEKEREESIAGKYEEKNEGKKDEEQGLK